MLTDWLTGYTTVTANLEAKESLHRWTGMVCIASALRRRVYMRMQHGTIYPNLYVFIVAESAKARKSTAMLYGQKMLTDSFPDLRIFGDDMTSQGLIKYMFSRAVIRPDGKKEPQGDFVIFSDELADLFSTDRARAAKMVIMLTTTYMCRDVYDHLTSRDSLERLYNMYPVVIGATDPRNIKVIPEEAIAGLLGRLMFVIEREKRHVNPGWIEDTRAELERQYLRECLIHDLQVISRMEGPMMVKPAAKEIYDAWYEDLSKKETKDPRADAFYHRCHTTAIQIAMLLSISAGESMVVETTHIEQAIKIVKDQLEVIAKITLWTGAGAYEQNRSKLIQFLQHTHGRSLRGKALKHMGVASDDFDRLTTTLVEDGTLLPIKIVGSEAVLILSENGAKGSPQ
jgi:hypothetical protein